MQNILEKIDFKKIRQLKKEIIILIAIIFIGSFLRFYDFSDLLRFNNDQVRDAQIVEAMHSNGDFPLLGPKAGGTKFQLGPAFYYLEYISGFLFGFSPAGMAFFIPLLSTISIYLFYLFFKKIFSANITLFLTFLYAISFYAVRYSHFAWNPNAIPFFVLAFLLLLRLLVKRKNSVRNSFFLGIIIGIGIQLHTTLLILMPATALVFLAIQCFKNKKIVYIKEVLISIIVLLIINTPFIMESFSNSGENIREFFSGADVKTSSKSIIKQLKSGLEFFLQGSAYYLTGLEPQNNWTNISKLLKSKSLIEIFSFIGSIIIFFSGILIAGRELFFKKNYRNTSSRNFLLISAIFFLLSFGLFFIIGNELNIRFFIILLFVPYLFLGFLIKYIFTKFILLEKIQIISLIILGLILFVPNIYIFSKTYNLENYTLPDSTYGGVSLGELKSICQTVQKNNPANQTAIIENFEYKRSLNYVCTKNNLKIEFSKNPDGNLFFLIVRNKNVSENLKEYQQDYSVQTAVAKRFTILTITKK